MKNIDPNIAAISDEKARAVLSRLHTEANKENIKLLWKYLPLFLPMIGGKRLPWDRLGKSHDKDYLASPPRLGRYCYLLARAIGAKNIVELGTSFGISTIYFALAVRDNGGGVVIGTDMVPSKVVRARKNIEEAGLSDYVEIREGNALDTLKNVSGPIDFHLSDGWPPYALPVLQLLAPMMRKGAIVVNHNAEAMKADHKEYLEYVRNPSNGFVSSNVTLAGELSVRVMP